MSVGTYLDAGAVLGVLGFAGSILSAWYTHRVYEVTNAQALIDRVEIGYHDLCRFFRAVASTGRTLGKRLSTNETIEVEFVESDLGPLMVPVGIPLPDEQEHPPLPLLSRDHELFTALNAAARAIFKFSQETHRLYDLAASESPNLSSADGRLLVTLEKDAREKLMGLRESIVTSRSTARVFRRRRT